MQQPDRRSRKPEIAPVAMTDRERTIFAATEAVFGAGLVVGGGALLVATGGTGHVMGLVMLIFGAAAVVQSVLVGLGLMSVFERRGSRGER